MRSNEAKSRIGGIAITGYVLGVLFLIVGAVVANSERNSLYGSDPLAGVPQFVIAGTLLQLAILATLFWLHAHAVAPNPEPSQLAEQTD